jgi:hypothetical protein
MTLTPGISLNEDSLVKTRKAVINHKPENCPQVNEGAPCNYFFSLYNPDPYGPVKVTFKIETPPEVVTLRLSDVSVYRGSVASG